MLEQALPGERDTMAGATTHMLTPLELAVILHSK